tara:strand:- start:32 stop:637 length:606 start_codon:yes stop_codon:yes gene_type:complete
MIITKINHKIKKLEIKQIKKIIMAENSNSIISFLSSKNLTLFLEKIVLSDKLDLFIIKRKNQIIGYSIIAKKKKYLKEAFNKIILYFLFDLIFNLKIKALINSSMSYLNFDLLFLNSNTRKLINNSVNLNMLAIHNNYQSKGIGKKFLNHIINKQKKDSNYITCEAENKRSENFYISKLGFKKIGSLIRFPNRMAILIKKI